MKGKLPVSRPSSEWHENLNLCSSFVQANGAHKKEKMKHRDSGTPMSREWLERTHTHIVHTQRSCSDSVPRVTSAKSIVCRIFSTHASHGVYTHNVHNTRNISYKQKHRHNDSRAKNTYEMNSFEGSSITSRIRFFFSPSSLFARLALLRRHRVIFQTWRWRPTWRRSGWDEPVEIELIKWRMKQTRDLVWMRGTKVPALFYNRFFFIFFVLKIFATFRRGGVC